MKLYELRKNIGENVLITITIKNRSYDEKMFKYVDNPYLLNREVVGVDYVDGSYNVLLDDRA